MVVAPASLSSGLNKRSETSFKFGFDIFIKYYFCFIEFRDERHLFFDIFFQLVLVLNVKSNLFMKLIKFFLGLLDLLIWL